MTRTNTRTETTSMAMWQAAGWSILPYNAPVIVVEPPRGLVDLIAVDQELLTEDLDDLIDAEQAEQRYRLQGVTGLLSNRNRWSPQVEALPFWRRWLHKMRYGLPFGVCLFGSVVAASAQVNPCTDPPPAGAVLNPTQVYALLAEHTANLPGQTPPVPAVTNYVVNYFPPGQGPTGTPVQGPITVAKTAWVLVTGTTNCYRANLPAAITAQGVTYVAYVRAHRDAVGSLPAQDSAWSVASNPFLAASTVLAAPGPLVFRQE